MSWCYIIPWFQSVLTALLLFSSCLVPVDASLIILNKVHRIVIYAHNRPFFPALVYALGYNFD